MAVCSGCQKSIRCIECATCGHCFVTSKQRRLQCPRCLDRIRTWKGSDVAFEYLAEQRQVGVAPVDLPFVAPGSPEVLAGTRAGGAAHRGLAWVVVVVLGVAGAAGVVGIVAAIEATGSRAVPCQLAPARSTLTFSASRDARGDYHVTALGRTVNESSRALHDVVVTWVVRYADGSAGRPTATALPSRGTVPEAPRRRGAPPPRPMAVAPGPPGSGCSTPIRRPPIRPACSDQLP